MGFNLLEKIAAEIENSEEADKQRNQVEEEGKKPEKKEKKPEKKEEGSKKSENPNKQAGPVAAEGDSSEAPPAGDEAVPAAPEQQQAVQQQAPGSSPVGISQVIDFIQANPHPDDASVHAFAEQNGMDPHQLEQIIYGLTTKFVSLMRGGKSVDQQLDINSVDPQELEAGMAIEMEHANDPVIAKKIALDHLAELPDYYTRLQAMEAQAKAESGAAAVPKKDDGYGYMDGQEETKEMDANQPVGAQNRTEL